MVVVGNLVVHIHPYHSNGSDYVPGSRWRWRWVAVAGTMGMRGRALPSSTPGEVVASERPRILNGNWESAIVSLGIRYLSLALPVATVDVGCVCVL